jgi:uncharacterized protein (DUF362 family)
VVPRESVYEQPATVFIASDEDKFQALDEALAGADFLATITRVAERSGKPSPRVAIKPNLMGAAAGGRRPGTYTDPELVERLVSRLHDAGLGAVNVVESRVGAVSVAELAAELGYTGEGYEIVDLSVDSEPFEYGGVIGRHPAAPAWRDADVRVSFAKNKTQWECFYTGAMANVLGCLPEPDKRRWYSGPRHGVWECVRTVLDAFPVHFGLVDAFQSRDGRGVPGRGGHVRATKAILASPNVVALDWVMGERMDVDPALNPMLQEALHRWGRVSLVRRGDLMDWSPWDRPGDATVAFGGLVGSSPLLGFAGGGARWTVQ